MEKKPLVSVIVPIYNPPKDFLTIALDCIKNQDYENIEVILVDDGSSEEIALYLDDYVGNLQSWKVVHKKNGGLSSARNKGYELSKGEYVQFLDADDYFDKELISSAVNIAQKFDAEIVIENFIARDYKTKKEVTVLTNLSFPRMEVFRLDEIPGNKFQTIPYNVWSKLFKKSFLDDNHLLHDEELYRSEDVLFTDSALILAERLSVVMEPFIVYRDNLPSGNTGTNDRHPDASALAWGKMYDFLVSHGKYEVLRGDFEVAMIAGVFWHLERLGTDVGRKSLAIAAKRLFEKMAVGVKNDARSVIELAAVKPEYAPLFAGKINEIKQLNELIETLNRQSLQDQSEMQALRYPSVRIAMRKLAGSIRRRIKL